MQKGVLGKYLHACFWVCCVYCVRELHFILIYVLYILIMVCMYMFLISVGIVISVCYIMCVCVHIYGWVFFSVQVGV